MESRRFGLIAVVVIGMSLTACAGEVVSEDIDANKLGLPDRPAAEVDTEDAPPAVPDVTQELTPLFSDGKHN